MTLINKKLLRIKFDKQQKCISEMGQILRGVWYETQTFVMWAYSSFSVIILSTKLGISQENACHLHLRFGILITHTWYLECLSLTPQVWNAYYSHLRSGMFITHTWGLECWSLTPEVWDTHHLHLVSGVLVTHTWGLECSSLTPEVWMDVMGISVGKLK